MMMKTATIIWAVCQLVLMIPEFAQAQAEDLFAGPCERYGVPKALAQAIAGHESGMRPWAMNIEGRPYLHASKDQAMAVARAALQAGLSFDIGLMQINAQWLRRYHLPLDVVFDPAGNVQVGVWILAQAIKRYGLSWQAVATYHTCLERNPERGRAYAAAIMARLRGEVPIQSISQSKQRTALISSAAVRRSPIIVKHFGDIASNEITQKGENNE